MKKRTLSLLLALCMMIGMIPLMAPRTEALDLMSIFEAAGPIVRGAINASEQAKQENWGFGKALAGTFKSIGKELLDMGDDDSSGAASTVIVNEVDLSEVELQLANIQSTLNSQSITLTQIKDSITANTKAVSEQLSKLSSQITDSTLQLQYHSNLTQYFSFHNQFYEAVSYYDRALTTLYSSTPSPMNIKNTFDQFYQLANVQYDGNIYSAIESLGKYLRGEYVSLENGSVIDILCKYYELAGYTKSETAAAVKDFVGNTYYTYCLATYYYLSIALFQNTYLDDNNLVDYTSDLGIMKNKAQIEADAKSILDGFAATTAHVFYDLNNHFGSLEELDVTYYKAGVNYVNRSFVESKMDVEPASAVTMPSSDKLIASYLGEDFVSLFGGMCEYTYTSSSNAATVDKNKLSFNAMKDGDSAVVTMSCTVGGVTVPLHTFTFNGKSGKLAGGYGTVDYPYVITTKEHYNKFVEDASFKEAVISLNASLDYGNNLLDSVTYDFKGTFFGNGHKISNYQMLYGGTGNCYGLFSILSGKVYDLTVANAMVQPYYTGNGTYYIGALAGRINGGMISRCEAVAVDPTYWTEGAGGAYIGCLVGEITNRGTLTNSIAYDCEATLAQGTVGGAVGGLVGRINGNSTVSYCGREEGCVFQYKNNNENNSVGGLVGEVYYSTIDHCFNYKTNDASSDRWDNSATTGRSGSFVGYCENLLGEANVLYTGTNAKNTLVQGVAVGTVRLGNSLKYFTATDFTKSKINLGGVWCFTNVSGSGNPIRLATNKSLELNTSNVATVFNYGEIISYAGLEVKLKLNGGYIDAICPGYSISTDYNANKAGSYTVTVSFCGASASYQVTVLPKAHTFKQVLEPSSCTTAGSVYYVCQDADCNESFDRQTLPARGHMLTHYDAIEADCNGTAQKEYWHCTVCGKYYLDEACTKESSKANLNYAGTRHSYTTPQYTWVKGNDGMYTCTASTYCQNANCPLHPKSNPLTETASMSAKSKEPATQTKDGKMTFVAKFTDPHFTTQEKDEIIPATHPKHTFAAPTYTWTKNADGSYSCTATIACTLADCYEYPSSKPLTEVAAITTYTKNPATQTKDGTITYVAAFTDSHFTTQEKDDVIPATHPKHTFGDPVYTWTKNEDGSYSCTATIACTLEDCYEYPSSKPLTEEAKMSWYSINPPSQTTNGTVTYVAEFTDPHFTTQEKDDVIPATHPEHTFADPIYTWIENEDGTYTCTATVACTLENCYEYPASKPLTEVATVTADITNATCKLTGKAVYTATFKDSHFTTQVKEIELPTVECPSKSFKDVKKGSWFHEAVDFAIDQGLMNGTSGNTFEPDTDMSRAMLVTVLWRMEGSPAPKGKAPFTDLKQSWYRDAVAWAYENDIVKGITDTTFEPDTSIIREQLAAIMYRYAQYCGIDVSARADLSTFKDSSKIRNYALDSAAWAYAAGLITGKPADNGVGVIFEPRGSATRAQVCTIMMRYINTYMK